MIVNNSRGMGFNLYEQSFESLESANENIDSIPLYYYVIINNTSNENHGTMYQKIFNSNNNYELKKILKLAGESGSSIFADKITIIESDKIDGESYTLKEFLETLKDFFDNY